MRLALSILLLATASGCANRAVMPGDPNFGSSVKQESIDGEESEQPLPPDDPVTRAAASKLKVMQTGDLGCTSEALGMVDVHERMSTEAQALDILKRRAVVLGAEGITGVEFHHGEGATQSTHLSGMAVRCRDILHGRKYDVVKELDVAGAMGKEDDAFEQLKKLAWATGANLVLNVKFEHGEGPDGKTHVVGTAVRAY